MLKLTRQLFALRPDVEYAEFHERALFNHILGSMDPTTAAPATWCRSAAACGANTRTCSQSFTCCVGSGMESHALHGFGLYYESRRSAVGQPLRAVDGRMGGGRRAADDGRRRSPRETRRRCKLTAAAPKTFTLALRRPSLGGRRIRRHGQRRAGRRVVPGAGLVRRADADVEDRRHACSWRCRRRCTSSRSPTIRGGPRSCGDRWSWPAISVPNRRAPARGTRTAARRHATVDTPMLVAAEPPIGRLAEAGRRASRARSAATASASDQDVELSPFYRLHRRTYAAYWDIYTPPE